MAENYRKTSVYLSTDCYATKFLTRFLGVLRNYFSISWIKGASPHHVVGAQCQNVHPMAMTLQCSAQNSLVKKIQCIITALAYKTICHDCTRTANYYHTGTGIYFR